MKVISMAIDAHDDDKHCGECKWLGDCRCDGVDDDKPPDYMCGFNGEPLDDDTVGAVRSEWCASGGDR